MLFVFDVNETMLDLSPLDSVFAQYTGAPQLRETWFDLMIRTALATTAAQAYRDFAHMGAACARQVAVANGTPLSDAAVSQVGAAMRALPAHPEVPAALAALRERGHRLAALANSPQAVVQRQLEHAGLGPLFNGVYSAEQVHALKPAPAPYHLVLQAEGVIADQAVMVAAHDWDIIGAQATGMHTVFVARGGRVPLPDWPEPSAVVSDLAGVVDTTLAR